MTEEQRRKPLGSQSSCEHNGHFRVPLGKGGAEHRTVLRTAVPVLQYSLRSSNVLYCSLNGLKLRTVLLPTLSEYRGMEALFDHDRCREIHDTVLCGVSN